METAHIINMFETTHQNVLRQESGYFSPEIRDPFSTTDHRVSSDGHGWMVKAIGTSNGEHHPKKSVDIWTLPSGYDLAMEHGP